MLYWYIKRSVSNSLSLVQVTPEAIEKRWTLIPEGVEVVSGTYQEMDSERRRVGLVNHGRDWPRDFSKCGFCGGPTPCTRQD